MAKLKIYTFPDLVLTQTAQPIDRVEKSLHRLADDMLETMYFAPGIGLAANQVGVLQRILVLDTDYEIEDLEELGGGKVGDGKSSGTRPPEGEVVGNTLLTKKKPRIIINPEITYREGSILFNEGCLSVPEYNAEVKRAEKLKLKYQDIDGVSRELDAEGLLAVAIQHEMDHLDGKLFIDRLSTIKKEVVKKRLRKERAEREQEESAGEADLESFLRGGRKPKGF